jgi:hypothetical protein
MAFQRRNLNSQLVYSSGSVAKLSLRLRSDIITYCVETPCARSTLCAPARRPLRLLFFASQRAPADAAEEDEHLSRDFHSPRLFKGKADYNLHPRSAIANELNRHLFVRAGCTRRIIFTPRFHKVKAPSAGELIRKSGRREKTIGVHLLLLKKGEALAALWLSIKRGCEFIRLFMLVVKRLRTRTAPP